MTPEDLERVVREALLPLENPTSKQWVEMLRGDELLTMREREHSAVARAVALAVLREARGRAEKYARDECNSLIEPSRRDCGCMLLYIESQIAALEGES